MRIFFCTGKIIAAVSYSQLAAEEIARDLNYRHLTSQFMI